MVRFYLGTEKAAQELLERRLRRVAFALHRRVAVAVRATLLDPLVEEAWQAHVLSFLEGVHGFSERRIIIFRALVRFRGRQRGIILLKRPYPCNER